MMLQEKPMENFMEGAFWMVLADNSNQTNVRHDTRDRAQKEAMRLAGLNPGVRFFVLRSIGEAIRKDPVSWAAHCETTGIDWDPLRDPPIGEP